MKIRMIVKSLLTGSALVGLFGVAQGCGPSIASYCEKVCDCQGCSKSLREDCTTQITSARKTAEDKGCAGQFDAALSCVSGGQCVKDQLDTAGCESEITALSKCGVGGPSGQDACQLYVDDFLAKYNECGIDVTVGSGTTQTCTDTLAKQATCLDACLSKIDCACTKDPTGDGCADKLKPYSDCVTPCIN